MGTSSASTLPNHESRHLAMVVAGALSPADYAAAQALAAAIAQVGTAVGWSLSIWGSHPSPLGWPRASYHDLTVPAGVPAPLNPLRPIFRESAFVDVLYLPSLTAVSLVGVVDPIPASLVVGVSDLAIPADFARAEKFHQQAQKLLSLASAVIVPSAALRDQLVAQFVVAPDRVSIIPPPTPLRGEIEVALDYLACFCQLADQPHLTRPSPRRQPMVSREERVLYLINHTTLKAAELPVIRSLGLEVYASKLISGQSGFRSGSVDYADNDTSSLPRWVLAELDRHNFYDDLMTPQFAKLLNDHFDVVICTALNNLIAQLMRHFKGRIVVRAFGREAPLSYANVFTSDRSGFWHALLHSQDRFWLGAGYDSIITHEPTILQRNALTLPLTMPDAIYAEGKTWVGTDPRVYFVCPDILSPGDYYGKIYRDFKANFGHLPHVIGGRQIVSVDDPNVIGFVTDERMKQYFRELRVMFYHSREPRHLHYHPLEAIVYGMPLIYMNGGLLEHFARRPDLPGACDTVAEANAKLQRILAGDEAFTRDVIESQSVILEEFAPEFVRRTWRERFVGQILSRPLTPAVVPFGQWQPPAANVSPAPTPELPLTSARRILFYGRLNTGDARYHITRLWINDVLQQTADVDWHIDLRWGSPTVDGADPAWLAAVPDRLHIASLAPSADAVTVPLQDLATLPAIIDPDNPPPPLVLPLPERSAPPYLELDDLYAMLEDHAVLCFPQPLGLLSPNLDPDVLTPLPIIVYVNDLAHEYGDNTSVADDPTALSREMAIWSRLASLLIFPSAFVRDDAIKRYVIPVERTRVMPLPYLFAADHGSVPIPVALPDRYLLAAIDDPAHDNLDTILEALRILRWRGASLPPLVLAGTGARTALLTDQPNTGYHRWLQQIMHDGQFAVGKDIILVDPAAALNLTDLCRNAQITLSVSRLGTDRFGLITAALRVNSPLIIGHTPSTQHFESWALLTPPDDSVVLADAIFRIINQPAESVTRSERGAAWLAHQRQHSPQVVHEIEHLAAGRAASFIRPTVPSRRKVTMASPTSQPPSQRPQSTATLGSTVPATSVSASRSWLTRLNTFVVHSVLPVFKLTSLSRYRRLEQELHRMRGDHDAMTMELLSLRQSLTAKSTTNASPAVDLRDDLKRLSQRLERLEAQSADTRPQLPLFTTAHLDPAQGVTVALASVQAEGGSILHNDAFYTSLELAFRGSDQSITERQQHYLAYLDTAQATDQQPVLDIGCGRGEFLRLLRQANVPCLGVDPNAAHVDQLQQQGFRVYQQGAVEYLEMCPAASLSTIVSFQVIEHVELSYLERWLQLAMHSLVDGGQLLLETVNPYCLATYRTFYLDPTHTRPLPLDLLSMLMWAAGFTDLQVFYQNPVLAQSSPTSAVAANVYETYAILGKRPAREA